MKKMSKSLGNIIDPLDMIEKYGTDATRLSLLLGNTPGNDMKLSEEKIAGFRNFTNKLWNISRFMLLNIENPKIDVDLPALKTDADKWIVSKLNNLISNVSKHIEENNFSYAGERLRDFTWGELADWYLEVAKIEEGKTDILNFILNSILKLWHPYVPFVTEAIWKEVYGDGALLMIQKWPVASSELNQTESSVDNFELFRKIISSIRQFRADYRIAPSSKIEVHMSAGKFAKLLMENSMLIAESTGMFSFQAKEKLKKPENTISFVVEGMEIYVLMFGFNVEKEKTRITKELEEAQKYSDVLENKLSNEQFVNNAPEAVVRVEKEKLQAQKEKIEKLKEQLKQLL
jgi:valyl-tRNA synthetase